MSRLIDIASGWSKFLSGDPAAQALSRKRLQICDRCPNKKQLSPAGKVIMSAINDEANMFYCGLCGCPLATLTLVPEASCKAGNWLPETDQYLY